MAEIYAENYELIPFAGSDNHCGSSQEKLAGMCSDFPITDENHFIESIKNGKMNIFSIKKDNDGIFKENLPKL